ncbi:MAG: diaminopropionate ammonia-lyase, partial [bacterium]
MLFNTAFVSGGAPAVLNSDPGAFHRRLPDYTVSPLGRANGVERRLGLNRLWVKDESNRLGLP